MKETRAEKAQRLVDKGRVDIWETTEHWIHGYVIGDTNTYLTVLYANGHFFCNCGWGQIHSHTDDLCAHALAVKLAVEKRS